MTSLATTSRSLSCLYDVQLLPYLEDMEPHADKLLQSLNVISPHLDKLIRFAPVLMPHIGAWQLAWQLSFHACPGVIMFGWRHGFLQELFSSTDTLMQYPELRDEEVVHQLMLYADELIEYTDEIMRHIDIIVPHLPAIFTVLQVRDK